MKIAHICTRKVASIAPHATLREAADAMRRKHVGSLVVVDDGDGGTRPVGIVTDRDLVVSVMAADAPGSIAVGDVMTSNVTTCGEADDVFDAITLMQARGVRRLPVVDALGELVGMVSADDIVEVLGKSLRGLSHALGRERVNEIERRC